MAELDDHGNVKSIHFAIGTSVSGQDHSEPGAGEDLRKLDDKKFKRTAMFTEYEPCGNTGALGGAACAHYPGEHLDRPKDVIERKSHGEMKAGLAAPESKSEMEVSYGTTYRYGPFADGSNTRTK
ncbi:hypothetical protein [Streptomyces sp. NPDC048650]|uniref:hypothetical protein n=1 Tax=Streptomyces sp. NPDC048650 TaxID=3365583 RepID=UPI003719CB52